MLLPISSQFRCLSQTEECRSSCPSRDTYKSRFGVQGGSQETEGIVLDIDARRVDSGSQTGDVGECVTVVVLQRHPDYWEVRLNLEPESDSSSLEDRWPDYLEVRLPEAGMGLAMVSPKI